MKKKIFLAIVLIIACLLVLTACGEDAIVDKQAVSIQVDNFSNYLLYQGDDLDLTNATVIVTYNTGETEKLPLTSNMISGYDCNAVGEAVLTVTYKKLKTTLNVVVNRLEVQAISVYERPEVIQVVQGGKLDLDGVSLKITYQNKTSIMSNLTSSMVSGFSNSLAPGKHEVQINFKGYSTPIVIEVVEKSITKIEVTTMPTVQSYFVDDEFIPAGLGITIHYDNDTSDTVKYTSETAEKFSFSYDFSTALTSSPISVTYTDDEKDYSSIFYLLVANPVCTNLEFAYVESVLDPLTHESNLVNRSYYPVSYSIIINNVVQAPHPITSLIEGDRIDWSSGKARLTFDDGTQKLVNLDDNSINILYEDDNKQTHSYRDFVYSEPGNYILKVSYGNMNKSTPLYVTVKAKRATQLYLENVESVTKMTNGDSQIVDRYYSDGSKVITDLMRYDILYDNGTYLCNHNDVSTWAEVTVDMLADDSDFVVSYAKATNGKYRIGLTKEGVSNSIYVFVTPITITDYFLQAPYQNEVLRGSVPSLAGGTLYIEYSNNKNELLELTPEMLTYKLGGVVVSDLSVSGDYDVEVVYQSIWASYQIKVKDVVVTNLTIYNMPTSTLTFSDFSKVDFTNIYFSVEYSESGLDESLYPSIVAITTDYLYKYDTYNVGYQDVTFRYGGMLVTMGIRIAGRYETYIEVASAPNVVYRVGESFNYDGLVINKHYSDGTYIDVRSFENTRFTFEEDDNSTIGKKELKITYKNYLDNVVDVITLDYYVISGTVKSISVDTAQTQFSNSGSDRVLKVTKNTSINTTGIKLTVTYEDLDANLNNIEEDIPLLEAYTNYDKNTVSSEVKNITVTYSGKTTTFKVLTADRTMTSIEVYKIPDINVYADGQSLNLNGGMIKRSFNDGTSDYIPMKNGLITHDYNSDYFESFVSDDRFVNQVVTINYEGLSAQMEITTYRRSTADDIISYSDTVSFYGNVKTPSITMISSVANFIVPEFEMYYWVAGAWTKVRPSIPGSYPIKVVVFDNEYYKGSEIQNQKMVIIEKIIEVRVKDASKIYGQLDPQFSYSIEGDTIDGSGNPINTVLVWNEVDGVMVQDKIQLKLVRKAGENVLFSNTGAIIGYEIGYELVDGDNQNDRYRIDFISGELIINPMVIDENVIFSGWQNLTADGNAKVITASFARNGSNVIISQSDMVYMSGSDVLDYTPWEAGTYTVRISDNYTLTNSDNYCTYTINP